jgi:hypothetical protein
LVLDLQTRRLYNHSNTPRINLFVRHYIDEVVLRDMIVILPPKLVDIKKECTIVNSRSSAEDNKELYFDEETGEDNKIGTTKVFY